MQLLPGLQADDIFPYMEPATKPWQTHPATQKHKYP